MASTKDAAPPAAAGAGAAPEGEVPAAATFLPLNPVHHAYLAKSLARERLWNEKDGVTKPFLMKRFLGIATKYFTLLAERFEDDKVADVVAEFNKECVVAEGDSEETAEDKAMIAALFVKGWYASLEPFYHRIMMHDSSVFDDIDSDFISDIDMGSKYAAMTQKEKESAFSTVHTLLIISRLHQGKTAPAVDPLSKVVEEFAGMKMGEKNTRKFTKAIWKAMTDGDTPMHESLDKMLQSAGGIDEVMKTLQDPTTNPLRGKNRKKAKKVVRESVNTLVDLLFGESDNSGSESGDEGEDDSEEDEAEVKAGDKDGKGRDESDDEDDEDDE